MIKLELETTEALQLNALLILLPVITSKNTSQKIKEQAIDSADANHLLTGKVAKKLREQLNVLYETHGQEH